MVSGLRVELINYWCNKCINQFMILANLNDEKTTELQIIDHNN